MKGALIALGVILSVVVVVIAMCIGTYNTAVRHEKGIKAQYSDMENILAQYSLKVKEAAQVPNMAIDGLSKVMREAMEGRYGDDGSKATFQWIQENYPGQVDTKLYAEIQQIIKGGRDQFQNSQSMLIDKKRVYETALDEFPSGVIMRVFGFPKIDLDAYKIISSDHAKEAFSTGVDKPIQL